MRTTFARTIVASSGLALAIASLQCGASELPVGQEDGGSDSSSDSSSGASSSSGSGNSSGGASNSGSGSSSGASSSSSGSGSSSGSSSGASSGSSSGGGRVPANHRPSDAQCQTMSAAGDCTGSLPDSSPACVTDSQCTSGKNGRCVIGGGGPAHDCSCTYDACTHDADCGAGETCACHGSPYAGDSGNRCIGGNCRVDGDCGAGGYCSPSSTLGICGFSVAGYYCHTAADTCIDDADCSSLPGGCVYSTSAGHWACASEAICL